jgi:tRNA (cmo5U34)-methyltransferase
MLTRFRKRFSGDPLVEVRAHDLHNPLALAGPFDAVVSGLAIHHLEDERKRELSSRFTRCWYPEESLQTSIS